MSDESTRRDFLDVGLKAGFAVCGAGMAVPTILYLLPARQRGPGETLLSVGPPGKFEPGTGRLLQADGRPVLVISPAPGKFRAFSAICTHLGCIVKWDGPSGKILCPCHAAAFGPDGKVLSGPPPRPLPEYEVVVTADEVKVRL